MPRVVVTSSGHAKNGSIWLQSSIGLNLNQHVVFFDGDFVEHPSLGEMRSPWRNLLIRQVPCLCPCFTPKGIRTGKKGHDPMSLGTKTSTTSSVSDGSGTGSVACGKKMDLYRLNASSNWIACVTALKPELDPLVTHFTPFCYHSIGCIFVDLYRPL